jgi:hypothetical protein
MHSWEDNRYLFVSEIKTHFSFQVVQRDNFGMLVGAGGWLAANRMPAYMNPGAIGVETNLTTYFRLHKKSFLQLHVSPGVCKTGYYINATVGICYQNQRTMRVRPKHYYVRTYEKDED